MRIETLRLCDTVRGGIPNDDHPPCPDCGWQAGIYDDKGLLLAASDGDAATEEEAVAWAEAYLLDLELA